MSLFSKIKKFLSGGQQHKAVEDAAAIAAKLARNVVANNTSRVVIYGAGQMGKELLQELGANTDITIAAVVDMKANYQEVIISGFRVESPQKLPSMDYDTLVIASKAYCQDIEAFIRNKNLVNAGVMIISTNSLRQQG